MGHHFLEYIFGNIKVEEVELHKAKIATDNLVTNEELRRRDFTGTVKSPLLMDSLIKDDRFALLDSMGHMIKVGRCKAL